jgi:hypothetical protein
MGKGRTTTGMVIGCLVKYVLHCAGGKLPTANYKSFKVIDNLIEKEPNAANAKALLDALIDLCGGSPGGNGLQNLRECIMWSKNKYEADDEHKQAYWKQMGINFIERYFYLICLATYVLEEEGYVNSMISFSMWMDSHYELRYLIKFAMTTFIWD